MAAKYIALAALGAFYGVLLVFLPPQLIFVPAIPIVIMLGLILWLLPDLGTYPERPLDWTYFTYFALFALWPSYIVVNLPGLPWLGLERIALFTLTLVALYITATSAEFRAQTMTVARVSKPFYIMFITFIVMQFITLPFAVNLPNSIKQAINNQFALTVVFFVSCFVLSKPGYPLRFARMLVVLAIIMGIFSVLERYRGSVLWANSIPSFLKVDQEFLDTVLGSQERYGAGDVYRSRGTFGVSLVLAEFMVVCTPFLLQMLLRAKQLWRRGALVLAWLLFAATIYVTDSRLGMTGFIIVHFAYAFVWALQRHQFGRRDLLGASVFYGFPIILMLAFGLLMSSHRLYTSTLGGGQHQSSDDARTIQRQMAIPKILANPIGHGPGSSGEVLQFRSPNGKLTVDSHYITVLLDFGVIGFISFYGMILLSSWIAYRVFMTANTADGMVAGPAAVALAVFVILKSVSSQDDIHPMIFMMMALVMVLQARRLGLITDRPIGHSH